MIPIFMTFRTFRIFPQLPALLGHILLVDVLS